MSEIEEKKQGGEEEIKAVKVMDDEEIPKDERGVSMTSGFKIKPENIIGNKIIRGENRRLTKADLIH